jgi:CRISPR-associated protein (TIGR02710 family)
MSAYIQLIATVGGSPEPLIASIRHWQPEKVVFVPSRDTEGKIEESIRPPLQAAGYDLSPARFEVLVLDDAQDFQRCVAQMAALHTEVGKWQARGDTFQTVVDLTAGTKLMTAALALHARRWKCRFSYVGGRERTKNGTGIVVSGDEAVVQVINPWDALGFQAVDDFVPLFDEGAYASAAACIDRTLRMVEDPQRKRELLSLKKLAEIYDAWDRFDHHASLNKLRESLQASNDLRAVLRDSVVSERILMVLKRHQVILQQRASSELGELVPDLLANARRRANEGRWDDATARLYRAIEAMAQDRLREAHGITNTKKIPLDRIPESLQDEWRGRARNGQLMVGLQDAYALLHHLGDPLGQQFVAAGLADRDGSPLSSRNESILAHGFAPISEKTFQVLWKHALQLAACDEQNLWHFPLLAAR